MAREAFSRELKNMEARILRLGSTVEEDLIKTTEALVRRDLSVSQEMIDMDVWVNNQRIEIMLDCLALIATQQPTGPDMRALAGNLEIVGELERIHDYVKSVGKISILIDASPIPANVADMMLKMAGITQEMLKQALEAFVTMDAVLAHSIPKKDNKVDKLFKKISHKLSISVTEDEATYESANLLQWAIHNLERSADRVTNICEWIVYMATGKYEEIDSEFESPLSFQP